MRKLADLEVTEKTDPATGNKIRISTTARLALRIMFPKFTEERNARLNDRMAFMFSNSAGNVVHRFKLGNKDTGAWRPAEPDSGEQNNREVAEIRSGPGGDFFFISAIRQGYIDILTLQDNWKQGKPNQGGSKGAGAGAGDGDVSLASLNIDMSIFGATNKTNLDRNRRHNMSALRILADLANKLDSFGETKAADEVTKMIEKRARWPFGKADEEEEFPAAPPVPKPPVSPQSSPFLRGTIPPAPPMNPVVTTSPEGFSDAPVAEPAESRVVGKLGPIRPDKDPYSYEFLPSEGVFRVSSYTYGPGAAPNPRAERAVGAHITRENARAWAVLSEYVPEGDKSPSEGRHLLTESTGDPARDWKEAQLQFAGWVNSGHFGTELQKKFRLADPGMPMRQLMDAELSPESAGFLVERFEAMIAGNVLSDLKDPETLLRYALELQNYAHLANRARAVGQQSMRESETVMSPGGYPSSYPSSSEAEDFTLASMDSIEDIRKKASANVDRLAALFTVPGGSGPFGRD